MYYAILAYHADDAFDSWSKEEDAALMGKLLKINNRLVAEKHLGPAARLGPTEGAKTLRVKSAKGGAAKGEDMVVDGPFAETKEQLLGFYVVDYPSVDGAIEAAREMRRANPTAVYEIRPVMLYVPGAELTGGDS
ncbi:MAG: YciI family protein [Rhizobiaceae bacterium]